MKCIRRADVIGPATPIWVGTEVERDIPKAKKLLPSWAEIVADLKRIAAGKGPAAKKARETLATMKENAK